MEKILEDRVKPVWYFLQIKTQKPLLYHNQEISQTFSTW